MMQMEISFTEEADGVAIRESMVNDVPRTDRDTEAQKSLFALQTHFPAYPGSQGL